MRDRTAAALTVAALTAAAVTAAVTAPTPPPNPPAITAPEGWQAEWCDMDWPRFSLAAGEAVDDWRQEQHQHQAWITHYYLACDDQ